MSYQEAYELLQKPDLTKLADEEIGIDAKLFKLDIRDYEASLTLAKVLDAKSKSTKYIWSQKMNKNFFNEIFTYL